ncbi:MAG: fibronectin type III domain-containing protein, partial [Janthinobacterium lividum]
ASNIGATSATVSFTAPTGGATGYSLTYTGNGSTQAQAVTASPVNLTNLLPGTTYTVNLVSSCGAGLSSNTVTTTFTTLAACPVVTNLSVSNITATSASVSFTPPATGPASYTITYTPSGGTAQTVTTTTSPVTLTGLTPGKGYTVSVVSACTGTGTGPTSAAATVNFTTVNQCLPVTGLTATNVTANSALLTFTNSPSGTAYTVLYNYTGGATQALGTATTPAPLTGLLAGKQYTANVVTTCGSSQTSTLSTVTFTTLAAAPTGAAVVVNNPNTATINFTVATGAVSYTVTYTTAGGVMGTSTSTAPPMVLNGLTPSTTYTVSIVATYPGGGTSAPVTLTFTTGTLGTRSALAGGQLTVYPNPAHQAFTVELPALGAARTAELELLNAMGQRVSQRTIPLTTGGTHAPVDATGLATGIYLIRVRVGGETATTRVVID